MDKVSHTTSQFSVLMSVYCREDPGFFYNSVKSVLDNTVLPDDIVIVVDGPIPKELDDVIQHFKKQHQIIPIFLKENVGLGRALNIGIQACKNDLIMRMDTDDYCISTRFEEQLSYFLKNDKLVLLGGYISEYDNSMSTCLGIRDVECENGSIKEMAKRRNPFNHMTVAFRKHAILSVGGYKHHLYMEDYNLWLRVISNGYLVGNIPKVLVNVRAGDNMLGRRKGLKYLTSEYQLYKLKKNLLIDGVVHATYIFCLRSLTRILPLTTLRFLYSKLRR